MSARNEKGCLVPQFVAPPASDCGRAIRESSWPLVAPTGSRVETAEVADHVDALRVGSRRLLQPLQTPSHQPQTSTAIE